LLQGGGGAWWPDINGGREGGGVTEERRRGDCGGILHGKLCTSAATTGPYIGKLPSSSSHLHLAGDCRIWWTRFPTTSPTPFFFLIDPWPYSK